MLTEDQKDHIEFLLSGLEEFKTKTDEKSKIFIEQVQENYEKFGEHLRLSYKQLQWLEQLYIKWVGPLI
jgi:hypothetical protein